MGILVLPDILADELAADVVGACVAVGVEEDVVGVCEYSVEVAVWGDEGSVVQMRSVEDLVCVAFDSLVLVVVVVVVVYDGGAAGSGAGFDTFAFKGSQGCVRRG